MDPKRPHSRRSAEIIAGNDDLLTELILLHLPATSLLRFKSVSKHWQTLISAPSFVRQHATHRGGGNSPPLFIFRSNSHQFFYFNPATKTLRRQKFYHRYRHTRILQSTNGLMLLECRKSKYGQKHYAVYNPTTRWSRTLIDAKRKNKAAISGVCLVFDPSRSPHYKIVCVRSGKNWEYSNPTIDIYDSQSRTWNYRLHFTPIKIKFSSGIYRNDCIYWIRPTSRSYYYNLRTDAEGKMMNNLPRIKTPWRRNGETNKNYVMESNGHVHIICTYVGPEFKSMFVYELSEDNSGWYDKYRVDLGRISSVLAEKNDPVELVGIVRREREEDSSVLLHSPGRIIRYTFSDGSFEVLVDFRNRSEIYKEGDGLQFRGHFCYQFVESLARV
ncbi:hypothetical protein ABFX02_10G142600 [Erythranthe guttata]